MTDRVKKVENGFDLEVYEKALRIDEMALEEAHIRQPELYYDVSKELAIVTSQHDEAKKGLAELESAISLEIKETARKEQEKITIPDIAAAVRTDKQVSAMHKEIARLRARMGILSALQSAYEMRSKSLGKLSDLYVNNYYGSQSGSVRVRSEATSARAERARDAWRRQRSEE